jgi:hypothetical protein
MTTRLLKTEMKNVEASDYSEFGGPVVQDKSDPVDICLPGAFIDKFQLVQLDRCPLLMSQHCAKSFDQKCELYAQSLTDINDLKKFLADTMRKRFYKLSKTSNCSETCEPFDPVAEESVDICYYIGNDVMEDKNLFVDVGLSKAVSISPYYMSKCQLETDTNPSTIPDNDKLIDMCMDKQTCQDSLIGLCARMTDSTPNQKLREFCNSITTDKNLQAKISPTLQKEIQKLRQKFHSTKMKSQETKDQGNDLRTNDNNNNDNDNTTKWILLGIAVVVLFGIVFYSLKK